ncbi:hypothetical protein ScPMuIL_018020 [Solemya velum]
MAESKTKVTHVIFDIDGLLLDTETIYGDVTQAVCARYGKEYTWELQNMFMGKTDREEAHMIVDLLKLPITPEKYIEETHKMQEERLPQATLMPGADKLVRHLHSCGVPMAVASGSCQWSYELKSRNHRDMFTLFHHAVLSGDDPDVQHGKPEPDCFQVAAKRFPYNPDPQNIVVFEDAANGVKAALAAGMRCVWIPPPQADRTAMLSLPITILNSLEEIRLEEFGLPHMTP